MSLKSLVTGWKNKGKKEPERQESTACCVTTEKWYYIVCTQPASPPALKCLLQAVRRSLQHWTSRTVPQAKLQGKHLCSASSTSPQALSTFRLSRASLELFSLSPLPSSERHLWYCSASFPNDQLHRCILCNEHTTLLPQQHKGAWESRGEPEEEQLLSEHSTHHHE